MKFPTDRKGYGKFIAKIRRDMDLTQAQFAKKVGCSVAAVGSWETGVSKPTEERFANICALFNISQNEVKAAAPAKAAAYKEERSESGNRITVNGVEYWFADEEAKNLNFSELVIASRYVPHARRFPVAGN